MSEINRDHIALQGSPTENGFRDFKRVVELRFTEGTGREQVEKGKGIWKMLDTPRAHRTNVYREIFRPSPPPDKGEFHPRLSNATFHDEIRFFRKSTWVTIFFPPSLDSLSLSAFISPYLEDGNLVLGEKASLPRRDWKSIMDSFFFLLLQFSGETIARFDSFLEYFILLKDIVIGIICYVSSIIRKREKKIA